MRTSLAVCAAVVLAAGTALAQDTHLDLTGRWRLVEPTAAERAQDTLPVTSPDELLITQTPLAIIIEHPSKRGSHPEAGVFKYGVGGTVGGVAPGGGAGADSNWGVSQTGTDLMISYSTTDPPDSRGLRVTVAHGSMWRLDGRNRLVIEFGERRTGQRPKIATRVYVKVKQ